jgi:hypothetical protein
MGREARAKKLRKAGEGQVLHADAKAFKERLSIERQMKKLGLSAPDVKIIIRASRDL